MNKVKKILILIIMLFMLIIPGCGRKEQVEEKSKVNLKYFGDYTSTKTKINKSSDSDNMNQENDTEENLQIKENYTILFDGNKDITLLIELDNPDDYHILDYNLVCEEDPGMIVYLPLTHTEYKEELLKDQKSLNWNGLTNRYTTIKLRISDEANIEKINIKLTGIFYADRESGDNEQVKEVNLNNKGFFGIYSCLSPKINFLRYEKGKAYYELKDYVNTTNLMINNEKINLDYTKDSIEIPLNTDDFVMNFDIKCKDKLDILQKGLEIKNNKTYDFNPFLKYIHSYDGSCMMIDIAVDYKFTNKKDKISLKLEIYNKENILLLSDNNVSIYDHTDAKIFSLSIRTETDYGKDYKFDENCYGIYYLTIDGFTISEKVNQR